MSFTLCCEGKNKKMKLPATLDELKQKISQQFNIEKFSIYYLNLEKKILIESQEQYQEFTQINNTQLILQIEKIQENLKIILRFKNQIIEKTIQYTNQFDQLIEIIRLEFKILEKYQFKLQYLDQNNSTIDIETQDDFDIYLEDKLYPIQIQIDQISQVKYSEKQVKNQEYNASTRQDQSKWYQKIPSFSFWNTESQKQTERQKQEIEKQKQKQMELERQKQELERKQYFNNLTQIQKETFEHFQNLNQNEKQQLFDELIQDQGNEMLMQYIIKIDQSIKIYEKKQKLDPKVKILMSYEFLIDESQIEQINKQKQVKRISLNNFEEFSKTLQNVKSNFYSHCQQEFDRRLSVGEDFKSFCQLNWFVNDTNFPIFGYDDYKLLIFYSEKLPQKSSRVFTLYNKIVGRPLPFAYKSVIDDKLKIPLASFNEILEQNNVNLISIGPGKCGKSKLLNAIFKQHINFSEDKNEQEYLFHYGVQAIFNSNEFKLNFNLFDFQLDFQQSSENTQVIKDIENILKIFPKDSTKILLHSLNLKDFKSNLQFLEEQGWGRDQIKVLVRDQQNIPVHFKNQFQDMRPIVKISKENYFESQMKNLLVDIINWMNDIQFQQTKNNFKVFQQQANLIDIKQCEVLGIPQGICDFQQKLQGVFNKINIDKNNIHANIFRITQIDQELFKIEQENIQTQNKNQTQKDQTNRTLEYIKKKEEQAKKLESIIPHECIGLFDTLVRSQDNQKLNIFYYELNRWQLPIIEPLMLEKLEKIKQKKLLDEKIRKSDIAQNQMKDANDLQKVSYEKDILKDIDYNKIKTEIQQLEQLIKEKSENIDKLQVSKEHFFRELNLIYDILSENNQKNNFQQKFNREEYLDSLVELIRQGCEFEFINGDNNKFHQKTMTEIFQRLETTYGQERPFVISVIGPQSTGKSTLLNFLFNTSFQMSAGRCTKGMYISYFETDNDNAKRVIILDTEGLLSIEKNDPSYDKKITSFNMALSQVLLINIMGDFNQAMKEILQMSILACQQLKQSLNKRPILFFVLRNCIDDNIEKMREIIDKIGKELKVVADTVNVELNNIVDYRGDESFCLMYSAFNKDDQLENQRKLYSFCVVNDSFRNKSMNLLQKIFKEASNPQVDRLLNLNEFTRKSQEVWSALNSYNSLLTLKSIQEVNDTKQLSKILEQINQDYLEQSPMSDDNDNKQNEKLQYKLKKIQQKHDNKEIQIKEFEALEQQYIQQVNQKYLDKTKNLKINEDLKKDFQKQLKFMISQQVQRSIQNCQINQAFQSIIQMKENISKEFEQFFNSEIETQSFQLQNDDQIKKINEQFSIKVEKFKEKFFKQLDQGKKPESYFFQYVREILQTLVKTEQMATKLFLNDNHIKKAFQNYQNKNSKQVIIFFNDDQNFEQISQYLLGIINHNSNYYSKLGESRYNSHRNDIQEQIQPPCEQMDKNWYDKYVNWFKNLITSEQNQSQQSIYPQGTKQYYSYEQNRLQNIYIQEIKKVIFTHGMMAYYKVSHQVKQSCKDIKHQKGLNLCFLQGILKTIETTYKNSEKEYLTDQKMYFKKDGIEYQITEAIFQSLIENQMSHQQQLIEGQKKQFLQEIEVSKEFYKDKLNSSLGDIHTVSLIAKTILQTIQKKIKTDSDKNYLYLFDENSKRKPDELLDEADMILKEKNTNQEQYLENIRYWATDISKYLDKVYENIIIEAKEQAKKTNFEKYKNKIETNLSSLKKQLLQIKKTIKDQDFVFEKKLQIKNDDLNKLTFELFLAFLTNPDDIEKKSNEINQKFNGCIKIDDTLKYQFKENKQEIQEIFGDKQNAIKDSKIQYLDVFVENLLIQLEALEKEELEQWMNEEINIHGKEEELNRLSSDNKQNAIGCPEVCPYCGAKCNQNSVNGTHAGNHQTKRHRIMGMRGSHKKINNQIELLNICCSSQAAQETNWTDSHGVQTDSLDATVREQIDPIVKQVLDDHKCTIQKLNFTLSWYDPNDLDLFVTCPCGSQIGLGCKSTCVCVGNSQLDMNFTKFEARTPTEHVTYEKPVEGDYKIYVRYYSKRNYDGIQGGDISKFKMQVLGQDKSIYQTWNEQVSQDNRYFYCTFKYKNEVKLFKFSKHCAKYYSKWSIIEQQLSPSESDFIGQCQLAIQKPEIKTQILKATKLL